MYKVAIGLGGIVIGGACRIRDGPRKVVNRPCLKARRGVAERVPGAAACMGETDGVIRHNRA
jgi:hypothetical protein